MVGGDFAWFQINTIQHGPRIQPNRVFGHAPGYRQDFPRRVPPDRLILVIYLKLFVWDHSIISFVSARFVISRGPSTPYPNPTGVNPDPTRPYQGLTRPYSVPTSPNQTLPRSYQTLTRPLPDPPRRYLDLTRHSQTLPLPDNTQSLPDPSQTQTQGSGGRGTVKGRVEACLLLITG